MTKIINLFGGPGIGKSRNAARLFSDMKQMGINCELIKEFAKELVWQERWSELHCQMYVTGEQIWRTKSLLNKVDYVISDSPIFLGAIYSKAAGVNFENAVFDEFNRYDNWNYQLTRQNPFNPKGREQNESESIDLDNTITLRLDSYGILYTTVENYESLLEDVTKRINL